MPGSEGMLTVEHYELIRRRVLIDGLSQRKTAQEFKVFYQKVPGSRPDAYTVDHSAGSFVYDTRGRIRLFVKHGQGAEKLAQDLRRLLDEG